MEEARKKRKSFDIPGHAHELTFSCYRRRPFLAEPDTKHLLLQAIERARAKHNLQIWAYVIMPEHVHLIFWTPNENYSVAKILQSIKQPVGRITIHSSRSMDKDVGFRVPGREKPESRFWQVGGGYDRNLYSPKAIWAAIEYIHMNPVKRGLVEGPEGYAWSSYSAYMGIEDVPFRVDLCEVWES
jgi:putative transposase